MEVYILLLLSHIHEKTEFFFFSESIRFDVPWVQKIVFLNYIYCLCSAVQLTCVGRFQLNFVMLAYFGCIFSCCSFPVNSKLAAMVFIKLCSHIVSWSTPFLRVIGKKPKNRPLSCLKPLQPILGIFLFCVLFSHSRYPQILSYEKESPIYVIWLIFQHLGFRALHRQQTNIIK